MNGGIQGQFHAVPVLGVIVVLEEVHQVGAASVGGGDHQAVGAGQLGVILRLHPVSAAVVIGEADDLGGQVGVRVVTFGVGGQVDTAGQLVLGDELAHGGLGLRVDLGGDLLVLALLVRTLLRHVLLGDPIQQLCQVLGDQFLHVDVIVLGALARLLGRLQLPVQLLLLFHDGFGGDDDVIDGGADGQHVALTVVDGAPLGVDGQLTGLLLDGLLLQGVMLGHLQIPQLPADGQEDGDAEHDQQDQDAFEYFVVSVFSVFPSLFAVPHFLTCFHGTRA